MNEPNLSDGKRYLSIYHMSFLFSNFKEKLQIAQNLKLHTFTLREIPLLLKAGIDVFYASYFLVLHRFGSQWEKAIQDLYENKPIPSLSRQILNIMIDVCSQDFKRFHYMMMNTSIYGVCATKNDPTFIRKIISVYKNHSQELFELLASYQCVFSSSQKKFDSIPLFLTLEKPFIMRAFLENIDINELFFSTNGQKILNVLLSFFIGRPNLINEFDFFLNKSLFNNKIINNKNKQFLFEDCLTLWKNLIEECLIYSQKNISPDATSNIAKSSFKGFFILSKFAQKYHYADLLQNFFTNFFEITLLNLGIQNLSPLELTPFFEIMCPKNLDIYKISPQKKKTLFRLLSLTYTVNNQKIPLILFLSQNQIITEHKAISLFKLNQSCLKETISSSYIDIFDQAYFNYLFSHTDKTKAIFNIDQNYDYFIEGFKAQPEHMCYLLKKFNILSYWILQDKMEPIYKIKKALFLSHNAFYNLFLDKDEKGNTPLHYACSKNKIDILNLFINLPENYLTDAFLIANQKGLTPLEISTPEVRNWFRKNLFLFIPLLDKNDENQVLPNLKNKPENSALLTKPLPQSNRQIKMLPSFKAEFYKIKKKYPLIYQKSTTFIKNLKEIENIQPILNSDWKKGYEMFAHPIGGGHCNFRLAYLIEGNTIILTKISRRDHIYTELLQNGDDLRKRAHICFQNTLLNKKILDNCKQND